MKFSRRSQRDLNEIWDHIAEDDRGAAERSSAAVRQKCRILAENPRLGRARDELRKELRSFTVGKFLIFYPPLSDGVEVVRLLHGARDIESIFGR